MKLSLVIVNYNVEYFLEQCLNSVQKAIQGLSAEVFVVDNHSFDGSCKMVQQKFPWVILIENKENLGFSKANNQAMRMAKGEYILLLNPDTVIEEDTLKKTVSFMDTHPDAGGLGVYMIDGKGKFLPESKRGLPTPWVSFCKISGLSRLFPKSKRFNRYHVGFLDKNKTHEIEILSGAFMFMRKKALDEVGLLDEGFFMYGEDIDLSYRLTQGGYKNYYFPETKIIHYKGESTRKSSVNYVLMFYNAMIIFARKHFSKKNAQLFSFLIKAAIYLRAGAAIAYRFVSRFIVPLTDAAGIIFGMWLIANQYQQSTGISWPENLVQYAIAAYTATWLFSMWIGGGYDRPLKAINIGKGIVLGTAIILITYGLLPKSMQFSRFFILLSAVSAFAWVILFRLLLTALNLKPYVFRQKMANHIVIVGKQDEAHRVKEMIRQSALRADSIKILAPSGQQVTDGYDAHVSQLNEFVYNYGISEVIFCARDNAAGDIMNHMSNIKNTDIDFRIAQPDSAFIIGSNSVNTTGETYSLDILAIQSPSGKRTKRIIDFFFAILFLLCSPLLCWFVKKKSGYFRNMFRIIFNRRSFVGQDMQAVSNKGNVFKPGIIACTARYNQYELTSAAREKINFLYTRDYQPLSDINLIFRHFSALGE
ncbi:MAG: glycosyltransferase family 2 protein [Flavobacteriales bacterium]